MIQSAHYLDCTKEQEKALFPNLKYIFVEFDLGSRIYKSNTRHLVFEKFKNYLIAKCPKLEKPIQIDNSQRQHKNVVFKSKLFEKWTVLQELRIYKNCVIEMGVY